MESEYTTRQVVGGMASYKRLQEYFWVEEISPEQIPEFKPRAQSRDAFALNFESADFSWRSSQSLESKSAAVPPNTTDSSDKLDGFKLKDINLKISAGSLVAVVGKTGSGKSSLLAAIAGEMEKTNGNAIISGSIAYCTQDPWIISGSIEENIRLFDGSNGQLYETAFESCSLPVDVTSMPSGVHSQIGERGANLSGGQKARIALARTIVANADINILDCPLAALDPLVGREVFSNAILGLKKRGKTVLMATHHLDLLNEFDQVLVMDNGKIVQSGPFMDLIADSTGTISELLKFPTANTIDTAKATRELTSDTKRELARFYVFSFYRPSYRELKRLNAIMQSPLVAHISETMSGMVIIRAHNAQDAFLSKSLQKLDQANLGTMLLTHAQLWFMLRLDLIGAFVTLSLSLLALAGTMNASFIALALSSTISWSRDVNFLLSGFSETEASMVAVERLSFYERELPREAARQLPTDRRLGVWPTFGEIELKNVRVTYPNLPNTPIIRDLSLKIKAGEKIGVVGRTGSGKSTLVDALFRMMELDSGEILIDGINIASVGLKKLRDSLQIIPQNPVLFQGTIRSNIDFENVFDDQKIWQALEVCGMKEYVTGLGDKLDSLVTEGGANFSMGQRQLLCLARSLLHNAKVIVLDEATSSTDAIVDSQVQQMISTQLKEVTVISIAHRLSSIAHFDRFLEMKEGNIVELGLQH
ncbi:hypothetical protein HDU84_007951 [Entophlyctis sp. JEL0112]|nr:hypothetical protein HDU84_007951 [Entophlyctis sp. JEL0112]